MRRLALCCLLSLPASAGGDAPAHLVRQSAAAPEKIEVTSTEAEQGIEGIRGAKAVFVVHGAPELVLHTLWDVESFPKIFPDVERLKVLDKKPGEITVRFWVDAIVTKATYALRRKLDRERGVISWRNVGEGDVKHIVGSWTVEPTAHAAYAKVTYTSYVDVGYFVPTGPVRDAAIRKIDEMAGRVRAAILDKTAEAEAKAASRAASSPRTTTDDETAPAGAAPTDPAPPEAAQPAPARPR